MWTVEPLLLALEGRMELERRLRAPRRIVIVSVPRLCN